MDWLSYTAVTQRVPVAFSNSRSLPIKRECDFQFPFPFPEAKKPFPLTSAEVMLEINPVAASSIHYMDGQCI